MQVYSPPSQVLTSMMLMYKALRRNASEDEKIGVPSVRLLRGGRKVMIIGRRTSRHLPSICNGSMVETGGDPNEIDEKKEEER